MARLRPIALEFGRKIPDHRCVLDQEDPQIEPQELDLSDSIDALLDEIDASCAHFEKQPDPEPSSMGLISDDGTTPETTEPTADAEPKSETQPEVEPEAESEAEHEIEPESIGDEALDALDAVSQSAEALLEESIDDLLDEEAPPAEPTDDAPPSPKGQAQEETIDTIDAINEDLVSELGDEQIEPVHALDENEGESSADTAQDSGPIEETEPTESAPPPSAQTTPTQTQTQEPETDPQESDDLLGNLDDALAGIGDELLMGDFEDADGEMIDSDSLVDSIDPAMLLDQLEIPKIIPTDDEDQADTEQSSTSQAPPQSDSPPDVQSNPADPVQALESTHEVRASVRVPDAIKASPSAALETSDVLNNDEIESIWQKLWRIGKTQGIALLAFIKAQGAPIAAKGVLAISKPLASKPAQVRDSIGYLAIWTMFLAMVLWIYVMFFRAPPPIVPDHAPTRMVAPGENLEPIENQMTHPLPEQP